MPEIAAAHRAGQPGARRSRLDLRVAGGIGLIAIAGLLVYPYANADEAPVSSARSGAKTPEPPTVVSVATMSAVREAPMAAPPLTLPYVPRPDRQEGSKVASPSAQRIASRPAPTIVAAPPLEPAQPVGVSDAPPRDDPPPQPAPPPAPPADPLQALKNALGACGRLTGVFERAMCEQRARLDQCDGYWGAVALCPAGRTDQGQ